MESQRPGSPQSLRRRARDIARDAHPDGAIATEVDERKRRGDFDLYVAPNVELALIHGIIADCAVAAVAQHRFQEADLERFAEIDDPKSMRGDASAGIAEAAWRLAKPQRVRVAVEDNSTKPCARADRRQMQGGAIERGRRVGRFRHSGERLGDAFRRFDDVGRSALSKRVAARLAIELRMALDEETVDGPRAVAKAIEERRQGREWLSVLADLPTRKAEAPGRAFEAKKLAVLTFRVDRRARRAEQPRKIVRTQHVRVAENLGDPPLAALARRRERPIEIRMGDLWRCIDDRGIRGGDRFP